MSTSLIARYTLDKWELVGNLQQARHGHRAISNGDRIYVVGGYGIHRCEITHFRYKILFIFSTEIWSVNDNDNTVNMKIAEPELDRYEDFSALFIVASDFCSKK